MLRKLGALAALLIASVVVAVAAPADHNQPGTNYRLRDLTGTGGPFVPEAVLVDGTGTVFGGSNPFPIAGVFTATLSGYAPGGTSATLAVTNVSAAVNLPVGTVVVAYNIGPTAAIVKLGASVTATTGDVIQPGGAQAFTVGVNTQLAAITAAGSTSLILTGGSGLATGWGGGAANVHTSAGLSSLISCDSTATYDAATSGSTELVALTASQRVYVCGYVINADAAVNVKLITGTGTACVTGAADITPAFKLDPTKTSNLGDPSAFYRGLKGALSSALCLNTSGGVGVQATVYYAKF